MRVRTFFRFLRIVSAVVLFFFAWTFGPVWQAVAWAATESQQRAESRGQRVNTEGGAIKSHGERFEKALESIREHVSKAEEKAGRGDAATEEIEAIKNRKAEIETLDLELHKEFAATEKKLRDAKLPQEILDRHHRFVRHYEDNFRQLKADFTAHENARKAHNTAKEKEYLSKIKDRLERTRPHKKHVPLDPDNLPFRNRKAKKTREPRTTKKAFEKDFPASRKGLKRVSAADEQFPRDRTGLWTRIQTADFFSRELTRIDANHELRRDAHPALAHALVNAGHRQKAQGFGHWVFNSKIGNQNSAIGRKPVLLAYNDVASDVPTGLSIDLSQNWDFSASPLHNVAASEPPLLAQATTDLPTSADLAETPEVQFTNAIRAKAQELRYNPVKIYEWVRNNIGYTPTYGSIQGADLCLRTKQCNDMDTASLLIALLRASGISARYVYGTVDIPIERAMNWAGGMNDPLSTALLFASAGIPVKLGYSAGTVKKLQLEHAWVEAWIDYFPSRGAVHKQGDTWIPLDASYKQHGTNAGVDFGVAAPFDTDAFINQVLGSSTISEAENYATNVQCAAVSQYQAGFRAEVKNVLASDRPGAALGDVLGNTGIVEQNYPFLLGTLPYETIVQGARFTGLPSSLRHGVTFELVNNDRYSVNYSETSLSLSISLPELADKPVTLSYSPATPADQAVIEAYAPGPHADGTPINLNEYPSSLPAYLVQVKAELRINGAVAASGLAVGLGGLEKLSIRASSPNRPDSDQELSLKAGEYAGIAYGPGPVSKEQLNNAKASLTDTAARLQAGNPAGLTKDNILGAFLHASALAGLAQTDALNSVRAQVMGTAGVRLPSSSVVLLMLSTNYFYGIPLSVGVAGPSNAEMGYRMAIAPKDGKNDKARQFLMVSGLDASAAASSVQEYLLSTPEDPVASVSAIKAMKTASEQGVPLYRIDPSDSATAISNLQLAVDVKDALTNASAAGLTLIAPLKNVAIGAWSGAGYEAVDPRSGNNYTNLNGPPNVIQGLPWSARGILLALWPGNAAPPATLAASVITNDLIQRIAGVSSGFAGLLSRPASESLDLLTTSLLYDRVAEKLGCYVDLSSSTPKGACMAAYLSLLCTAMSTPVIADTNAGPVADAGPDRIAGTGETVTLDGSRSFDPDNDPLVYQWQFITVPEASSATLADAATATPSFTPDAAGVYTVELVVSDGKAASAPDTVRIIAAPAIVAVPSVIGLTRAEAENVLTFSGLSIGAVSAAPDSAVEPGWVTAQSPAAGTSADRESSVSLVLSTGSQADTQPPTLSITLDKSPALYAVGAPVRVTIDASDAVGVGSIAVQIDNTAVPASLPVTTIQTTGFAAGSRHTIEVTAQDISQNTATATTTFGILDPDDTVHPEIAITAPAADAAITAPTDIIGTVSDTNLFEYTLSYAPAGKTPYTVFAKGNQPVTAGVLGRLDPSLMKNGIYDIILTAVDANGNTTSSSTRYRVTGDLKVGNFTVSFTDLTVPVAGIPVTVTRTYDSREKSSHDFGNGWTIDIQSTRIEENTHPGKEWTQASSGGGFPTYCLGGQGERYVAVSLPDGRVEEFDMTLTPQCQALVPIEYPVISYTPRFGTTSALKAKNTGLVRFDSNTGIFLDLDTLEPYNPSEYLLTTADGMVYELDQNFGVRKVTDTNGNAVTYTSGGVLHSAGKSISFVRDANNRITRITDPGGAVIAYTYDEKGNLKTVTDQAGNITTYTYNTTHGLLDIYDPLGRRAVRNEYDSSGRLTAHIDSEGKRIEYTHDIAGRQEAVQDRNGNVTVYIYDDNGRVLRKTDPQGNTTTFTYDSAGNKTSETDPLGNTIRWTYDAKKNVLTEAKIISGRTLTTSHTYNTLGKLLTTTDPKGNVTTNTYDTKGNLLTTTDALGNTTTNTYDTKGNLTSTKDALGNTTTYEYDAYGNRTKQTTALGAVTKYTYDSKGNKLTETDPKGSTTTYAYDANNRLLRVINADGAVTKYEYDAAGNKISDINPLGIITRYVYDSANRLIETQYPDGTTTKVGYDAEGNRVTSTDQLGRVTTNTYNANKQLVKTTYADGTSRSFGYDSAGRQTTVTDALGNVTTKEYDALGRVISSIDPEGNTTSFEYDSNGNQVKQVDANGNATTFAYDANNRLTTTILPGGQHTVIGYDALGRKTSETDAAGNKTQFEYDAHGNLIKVADAEGGITKYEYRLNNNRTAIQDARGNRTTFAFNGLNRVTSKTMPNGGTETYAYDKAGRQITKTDAKGQKIAYGYDANSRLITRTYPDGSVVGFSYTSTGKRKAVTDKRGTTTYTYDDRDRMAKHTYPDGQYISYGYDQHGRIKTLNSSLTGTITYAYTNSGRLKEVTDPQGNVTSYSYDLAGSRTGLAYPNGTSVTYTYDNNNRLTNLTHKNGVSEVIASYAYTLGAIGNRTRIDEANGISRQYQYDKLYRLTQEKVADPTNAQTYQYAYSYDAVGNRQNKTNTAYNQAAVSNDYTYNNADQLLTENGVTYTYDLNGNLATRTDSTGTTTYVYNYDDRLVEVTSPNSLLVTYGYDADGNRIEAATSSGASRYLVDTNRSLAQVLAEYSTTGTAVASYVYADDLISMNRGNQTYYYHFDGLGSTRLLTDATGAVSDSYEYDAFGNQIVRTGTTVNDFLFTGQQYDANLGFYYLRARYYQPDTGRFTGLDPFTGDPYAPMSLHKYLYAANDPINKKDPTGKFSIGSAVTTIAVIGALAAIAFPRTLYWEAGQHCYGITIKRKHIDLSGEDQYGHWWVEVGIESYGWWPKYHVGYWDTLTGIEAELNGQTTFGGTPTQDPHHGDYAEDTFNPYITPNAPISYKCTNAKTCIKNFANSYSGNWSWPLGQNCHSFQESMMSQCHLEKR